VRHRTQGPDSSDSEEAKKGKVGGEKKEEKLLETNKQTNKQTNRLTEKRRGWETKEEKQGNSMKKLSTEERSLQSGC
jgi:hypothetical protein